MHERELKIAIFSDSVLPVLNGVSVSIDCLVRELRNRGHSVHVFCPHYPRHRESDPNCYRFRSIETPWTKGYPLAYPPFWRMLRKFRRHSFDLIHTHTPGAIGFVGLRWAESHEIPLVSTYHTLYDRYHHYFTLLPRRYVRYRIAKHTNWYYSRVDHVITPSEASLKWLRRHSVQTPATVIPTGAPARRMLDRSEIRHALGIPPEQKILLYVGRLAKEKNMGTLFEMAARVFERDPSVRLMLVGDGPFRAECHELVRSLGIGNRTRFIGFVQREEVDRYYAAADLFVFSSITETQGLVVQEAMTYGLPAIAVIGGGASAGIEEGVNGFVVKNDAATFAETVLQVLGDETLHTRLSDGASRSVRAHGTGEMADRMVQIYREVLAAKAGIPMEQRVATR
jgi:1,2-diacylglycerol 3-alpha-glucosyltransferase